MYLKKLTLRGFKSFASTTTLVLEPGITCIVGPNGSGKSNVVDALAWVMGEQGAKTLRGASMEDVIFAGTSKRAPLGRAEIQLTIDNTDGALPIDYTEVTISRTKFRNGNSEYAINGATCRLLDVRELLSDSGIGREMHVIVGQGHLEQILQATPETRRGFVEEAAGVLKHRERKEKALRKLDATEANLHRLTDLLAEIRRQLKPLGRQAEVARRATAVQADLRDAKARLLADDLVQATSELATELADEQSVREQRRAAEAGLAAARTEEDESRAAAVAAEGAYRRIQETWFALAGVGERVRSVVTLAGERVRVAEALPPETPNPARDPETLLAQAAKVADDEARLRTEIDARAARLTEATAARTAAETAHAAAERAFEVLVRANSDRREGLARLSGQLATLKTRLEAGAARLQQLRAAVAAADEKALVADREHADRQASLPDLEAGEHDLDSAYEAAAGVAEAAKAGVEARRGDLRALTERRAGLVARAEALRLAARAADDGAAWLAAQDLPGVQGPLATMIRVEPGYERAVAAALGPVVEAVVVGDLGASVAAVAALTAAERGRAGLVVAGGTAVVPPRSVMAVVTGDAGVLAALTSLIGEVRLAETLAEARGLAEAGATVVTPDGAYLSPRLVWGGSDSHQSAIQLAAALADAEAELVVVDDDVARGEAGLAAAEARSLEADAALAAAIRALNESDAAQSAALEQLSRLGQTRQLLRADAGRLSEQAARAGEDLDHDQAAMAELQARLAAAESTQEVAAPDPADRDAAAETARRARAGEMEARLGLRTVEERVRSLAGQAETLRRTAESERSARAAAERRRGEMLAQAAAARAVAAAGQWLLDRVDQSAAAVERERAESGEARTRSEAAAEAARIRVRDLAAQLEALVDSHHRDELARAQQKMRIDALAERALAEAGLDAATLMSQYGPDQLIPGDVPGPYARDEQLRRLRTAERDLQLLGKINPLALEEFDAMQERHTFLATQLEDLKKTRADLLSIVDDVDARVQEVFAAAYQDVEREFAALFARLFPGGEGRLLLTAPGEWLTTGIEVEARPAGKKVKRLSLLSGGERSLVAVCFLVALFKARPSPFYILDEVEAALDDTNLGRLLDVYEELRADSQLLVITHQKRTMEIADTLYGVTMGSDGTSTVVSQRLREE